MADVHRPSSVVVVVASPIGFHEKTTSWPERRLESNMNLAIAIGYRAKLSFCLVKAGHCD